MSPYILIDAENHRLGILDNSDNLQVALSGESVAALGGKLRPGVLGADIDPPQGEEIAGDLCAEALVAWCVSESLPYLVRESGRPGGRHVLALAMSTGHLSKWARQCRRISRIFKIPIDDRTNKVLRTLRSPHRRGYYSPVISCTMTPQAVIDAGLRHSSGSRRRAIRTSGGYRVAPGRDLSRSGREYGLACAMARLSYSARAAWEQVNLRGGKSAANGELWWRRYVWMPAVTTVAAEKGFNEDKAWSYALAASPVGCRKMGRRDWSGLWKRALAEAKLDRPRRYRVDTAEAAPDVLAEIEVMRRGLQIAADHLVRPLRPQKRRSVAALLYVLAPAIVQRSGSISCRQLAILSNLDPKTVRAAIAAAVAVEVLEVTHEYEGGAQDCRAYGPGARALAYLSEARATSSPTSCSTPLRAPTGHCHPPTLRSRLTHEQHRWRLRCTLTSSLPAGESLASSLSPLARLLRSLWYQRSYWRSLAPREQAARRALRRRLLHTLSPEDTSAWFHWLARREEICAAADKLLAGEQDAAALTLIEQAPNVFHRGMQHPQWRVPNLKGPGWQPELAA